MSSLAGAGVMAERSRNGRCITRALLGKAQKIGKLMKARTSRLSCFGVRDRFMENQVVLAGNHLYWTAKDISGIEHFIWTDHGAVRESFCGHLSLATPDCLVSEVPDSTCFMIREGPAQSSAGTKAPIIFDAGSQECRDEWVEQLAARVERCQAAFCRLPAEEAEPCAICLETEDAPGQCTTHCGHHFHKKCLAQWLATSRTCPCCRQVLL